MDEFEKEKEVVIEKRVQIDDNRILFYNVSKAYAGYSYRINEGYIEDGYVTKTCVLSQWDDYGLNGWLANDEGVDRVSFEYDINHPLYMPLFHLLNYDEELIIDDDDSAKDYERYLVVKRKDNKMIIEFVDASDRSNPMIFSDKFHVFIKNIVFDGRSKIDQDGKDTKLRLLEFFKEAHEAIMNDCHQIGIEEYLLGSDENAATELQKVFKIRYKKPYDKE